MNTRRSSFGGITAVIFVVGFIAAFSFGGFHLSIFFATLAFCILFGALSSGKPGSLYGAYSGFVWLMALAFFFATHAWPIFLLAVLAMVFMRQIVPVLISTFTGMGFYNRPQKPQQPYYQPSQPQQPYYQPPQPQQQSYMPYEGGYQQPTADADQEGKGRSYYPPQSELSAEEKYSQPQALYPPQQMPPQ